MWTEDLVLMTFHVMVFGVLKGHGVMELGHLLTHSGLTYPEVSS